MNYAEMLEKFNDLAERAVWVDCSENILHSFKVEDTPENRGIIVELVKAITGRDRRVCPFYHGKIEVEPLLIEYDFKVLKEKGKRWWYNGEKFEIYPTDKYPADI